jgi:hypothetical protein
MPAPPADADAKEGGFWEVNLSILSIEALGNGAGAFGGAPLGAKAGAPAVSPGAPPPPPPPGTKGLAPGMNSLAFKPGGGLNDSLGCPSILKLSLFGRKIKNAQAIFMINDLIN